MRAPSNRLMETTMAAVSLQHKDSGSSVEHMLTDAHQRHEGATGANEGA